MNRASWGSVSFLLAAAMVLAGLAAAPNLATGEGKKEAKESPGKYVFGLGKVWTIHLELTDTEYRAMQPKSPPLFPGFGPAKPAGPIDSDHNVFGTEFPWVVADVTANGEHLGPVALRYKGNSTYMAAARGLKRSLKIEFDHYDDDARFHGVKTLNLNCSVLDPTRIREAMAYTVFRDGGVPASRTALAEVSLTVPGKYDREYLGLYTIIEQVDRAFLKNQLQNNKGLLLKPERMRSLDYLGEDWERYRRNYQPRREPTKTEAQRIIDFVRLVNKGTDEEFAKKIADYMDVDAFLRFLACNAMVSAMDTFFALGHNYYLYLHPETNRFHFIPWDLDLALGNFAMMATHEQQFDLSLRHPYPRSNKLTERLLGLPGMDARYVAILRDISAKAFTQEKLLASLAILEKASKDAVVREGEASARRKEPPTHGPGGPLFGQPPTLRQFVEKRVASVAAQVTGKSLGIIPGHGFPWGGGPNVVPPAPRANQP